MSCSEIIMSGKITRILTAVTVLVCAGYTAGLSFQNVVIEDKVVRICFPNVDITEYDYFHLNIHSSIAVDPAYDKIIPLSVPTGDEIMCADCLSTEKKPCLTDKDIIYITTEDTEWLLNIEDKVEKAKSNPALEAKATIKNPGTLPSTLSKKIYVIGSTKERILKVEDAFTKLFFNNEDSNLVICTEAGAPTCFYKYVIQTNIDNYEFRDCIQEDGSTVPLCGGLTAGTPIKDIDGFGDVTVSVDYDTSIAVITTSETLAVEDVIAKDDLYTCDGTTDCKIADYEAVIVNYVTKKQQDVIVQDRVLTTYPLLAGTVEVQWEKDDDEYFRMTRKLTVGGTEDDNYHKVNVDCTLSVDGYCNAYYIEVPAADHDITIQVISDWVDIENNIGVNIWKRKVIATKNSQIIHVETTATSFTDRKTEVDVCFNYVANAFTQGTHYEFLAINSNGMWKKFLGEKKKDEFHACFYALDLLTAEFDENSKFLVLLRNTTNRNVLASGEVALNLQAPRAIKPEVDNGNNGSTSTLTIVGAAIGGIACLMALVAAAVMFVMKIKRDNDGLQYPLHRTNIEQDSSYIHGLDNPIPTM